MYTIKHIDCQDPKWANFVYNHSGAEVFHHPAWIKLIAECYGYCSFVIVAQNSEGNIVGGLPVVDVKSWLTGHRWVSLPFSDFCPPIFQDNAVLKFMLEYLIGQYKQRLIPMVEIRYSVTQQDSIHQFSEYFRHTLKLNNDPDIVYYSFDKTRVREPIRQAMKRGVEIRQATCKQDILTFYHMLVKTRQHLGVPVQPMRYFELLWDNIIDQDLGFLLLAFSGNTPIGGTVCLNFKNILTAKYNASTPENWRLRANNLLYWSAIKWGCEHGYQVFDWGRTDLHNESLRDFKCGWGSEEEILHYSVLADCLPAAKLSGGMNQRLMASVIQNSPAWVCRMIGELLYGHFA